MSVGALRLEKRLQTSAWWQAATLGLALLGALVCGALLIMTADASVIEAARAFLRGAFGDRNAIAETLVQSTPLIFTGLAVVVAFRARVWNIGAEGQFFAGAMAATWVALTFSGLPPVALVVAILVASTLAGGIWGLIPGILKVRYGTSEVVVTVMLNFIMQFILSYLLGGPWRDPSSFFSQSEAIPDSAFFPTVLASSRLHVGFLIAVVSTVAVYVLLWRTTLGYEIRAIGSSSRVSQYRGIRVAITVVVVMVISGALAGIGGASEVAGLHHRLRLDISTGYGFTGIMIALLARLNPFGALVAAIGFGALVNGSTAIQIATGVPVALVLAIQGLTLICVLMADVLSRYRVARTADV